jgi:hypothetical protein
MPIPAGGTTTPDPATPLGSGPCAPWEPIWCCELATGSAAVTGAAVQAATEVLWALSGQRFGLCEVTLRPCRRECRDTGWPVAGSPPWPQPILRDGQWVNVTCGACSGPCSCTALEEAVLPGGVYNLVEVRVDGVALATTAYRLDDNRILVRVDGGTWPTCQDLSLPDTAVGTWSVTATFGEPVPVLGQQAVGELACEMVRACRGEDCRLPANVQQLARQGVTISFPESQDLVERLYFGRLFLNAVNPNRLRGRPQVYDVDGPRFRRTGT